MTAATLTASSTMTGYLGHSKERSSLASGRISDLDGRLATFRSTRIFTSVRFALAGFAYDGRDGVIKCESCALIIHQECDDPFSFHVQRSPDCAFLSKARSCESDPAPLSSSEDRAMTIAHKERHHETSENEISGHGIHSRHMEHLARENQNGGVKSGGDSRRDAVFELPVVQAVVSMGFPRDLVETVWREVCGPDSSPELSATELFLAVERYQQSHSG